MVKHSTIRAILWSGVLFAALGACSSRCLAQEIDCLACHQDVAPHSEVHSKLGCQQCHSNVTRVPHGRDALAQLGGQQICAQCHEALESTAHSSLTCEDCHGAPHDLAAPQRGMCAKCHRRDAKTLKQSVHSSAVPCQACHDKAHTVAKTDDPDAPVSAVNQIRTCGRCHEPMMDGYLSSVHARALLVSGLAGAPACTDCHGSHNIGSPGDAAASTSHQKVPETCGGCHVLILRRWAGSAHGAAWKQDENGPVCTTCHHAHTIVRPTRPGMRHEFPEECGQCHNELYLTFRDSFHGQATALDATAAAICSDCHTPHENLPADDPRSSINPDNLGKTCGKCHEAVNPGFLTFDPHADPRDAKRNPQVHYVWLFMLGLLLGVFAFFGAHDLLWLQRGIVGAIRGEYGAMRHRGGPYVRRFTRAQMQMHVTLVVSFLLLAATGLPLKFFYSPWAPSVSELFGGVETAQYLHRLAAIVMFGLFFLHVAGVLYRSLIKRERGYFWGPGSLVPQPKDFVDLWANLKYFLYLGPRPTGDRWTYWEKFDYLAVFWGVAVIGLSGLMLWLRGFFTEFLPGWTLNAAFIIHSEEALLATGFIFVFHFFHTHLRPESFPLDPVIFMGSTSLERFKDERPLEYERLVESGELNSRLVDPPSRATVRNAYLFGFTAMAIGLLLAAAIFRALLDQLGGV